MPFLVENMPFTNCRKVQVWILIGIIFFKIIYNDLRKMVILTSKVKNRFKYMDLLFK